MTMEMDEVARRWMYKTAKTNFWRVSAWYEFEDLLQDGYFWYYSRVKKYPHVTERRHMMRLFQIRYTQHIHELSNRKTKQTAEVHIEMVGGDLVEQMPGPVSFERLISEAPDNIKKALQGLLQRPEQLRGPYTKKNGVRETTNGRLCRVAGIPECNITKLLRDYLQSGALGSV